VIEPLDEDLRACVEALRAVDRPSPAARDATWAGVLARTRAAPTARPRSRVALAVTAAAAALALYAGASATGLLRRAAAPGAQTAYRRGDGGPARDGAIAPVPGDRSTFTGPVPEDSSDSTAPVPEDMSKAPVPEDRPDVSGAAPGAGAGWSPSFAELAEWAARGSGRAQRRPERGRRRPGAAALDAAVDPEATPGQPSLRAEEIASFRQAQAALADGRLDAALRQLDEHGERYPGGFFEEERQVSRAATLCKLGRVGDARAARDEFLRERPASHLGERARQICAAKIP